MLFHRVTLAHSCTRQELRLLPQAFRLIILGLGILLATSPLLSAQYATQHVMVTKRIRGADALRVVSSLDMNQAGAVCEFNVTITNPKRPSPGDRDFVVVLYLTGWGERLDGCVAYSAPLTLAEKTKTVSATIPLTQNFHQGVWSVGIFEAGVDIENRKARAKNTQAYNYTNNLQQNSLMCAAFIQGTQDSEYDLETDSNILRTHLYEHYNASVIGTIAGGVNQFAGDILPVAELPNEWWMYLSRTFWVVTTETLAELRADHPNHAQNLHRYLVSGGKLIVVGDGSLDDRKIVEEFAELGKRPAAWELVVTPREQWWNVQIKPPADPTKPKSNKNTGATSTKTVIAMNNGVAVPMVVQASPAVPAQQQTETPEEKRVLEADGPLTAAGLMQDSFMAAETFLRPGIGQHYQNLTTVLFESDALLPSDYEKLNWLYSQRTKLAEFVETKRSNEIYIGQGSLLLLENSLRQVPDELLSKQLDHISLHDLPSQTTTDRNWFWSNLNRAVGKPPVWAFVALVGICGLVLGPGLLYFTGRLGRRSLMLFLVPVVSFLATLTIIAYGILNEGFDTHLRITSATIYDANLETGVIWSRQNYFSGLPPSAGLTFSRDIYARPVPVSSRSWWNGRDPRKDVDYRVENLEEERTWKGWLRPRTQQQMLVGQPTQKLELPIVAEYIASSRSKSEQLKRIKVTNTSPSTLPFVLLRGADKDYYLCEKLAPGESRELEEKIENRIQFEVLALMNKLEILPEPPEEMEGGGQLIDFGADYSSGSTDIAADVINNCIRDYTLPPYSFLTLLPENPAVYVPIDGLHSEDLHFFKGTNAW